MSAAQGYVDPLYEEREAIVSVVTTAEVFTGIHAEGEQEIIQYLDSFPLLDIGREEASEAARLRRSYGWKLPDAFQAALAQRYGLRLATRNTSILTGIPSSRCPTRFERRFQLEGGGLPVG